MSVRERKGETGSIIVVVVVVVPPNQYSSSDRYKKTSSDFFFHYPDSSKSIVPTYMYVLGVCKVSTGVLVR